LQVIDPAGVDAAVDSCRLWHRASIGLGRVTTAWPRSSLNRRGDGAVAVS
jgi:hypothetical protein